MTPTSPTLNPNAAELIHSTEIEPVRPDVNVGSGERKLSVAAGAAMLALGLSRRSLGGLAVAALGGGLIYRGISGRCHTYAAMGIDRSDDPADPTAFFRHATRIEVAQVIDRSPWELYDYWRNIENLPRIMSHLESVHAIDETRSRWKAKAPAIAGGPVEWNAEIINDEPNALIAWRSLDADVDNAGSVRFVPSAGGTEVKVVIDYIPPGGRLGDAVAKLFREDPEKQIREDLARFKTLMETGQSPQ